MTSWAIHNKSTNSKKRQVGLHLNSKLLFTKRQDSQVHTRRRYGKSTDFVNKYLIKNLNTEYISTSID